ncbi:hypothetical protein SKAU_G00109320 [Synaphobranchus kaupii]|uniref:Uncharacterized protein n=1 Tax=Synaphobranchus kaupii TaxID=118154 RepID=A0A9Q1G0T6_SYNKA|nr:hypothetical protein SKAU_G00109320 [Synaphobranchus kaupii]
MRRFAAGVTTVSHQLYGTFMRQLSSSLFEWDEEDVRLLREAKRSELEGKRGMVGLTDAEVSMSLTKRELALHCRRRTRGAAVTERLVGELIETFDGEKGHDALGIPLLDHDRIQAIWAEQRRHLHCIQDPPGVSLYTKTGQLTKGGVTLPVFRCARGSTSLESFHLHLNRFIPGGRANAMHFQAFLLDGLVRWNENRAAAAVEGPAQPLLCYSGHLQHSLNQLAQEVLGQSLVKDYTKPGEYTGELIGIEYLYSQTGRVLQDVSSDPDAPDAAAADIQGLDVGTDAEDEGLQEYEDPTVHYSAPSPIPSAARSGDPADAPPSGPSSPAAPEAGPQPAVASQPLPPPRQLLPKDNSRECSQQVGTTRAPILPPMHTPSPLSSPILLYFVVPAQPVTAHPPLSQMPKTTAWRHKKAEREAAEREAAEAAAAAATTTGDSTPPQKRQRRGGGDYVQRVFAAEAA